MAKCHVCYTMSKQALNHYIAPFKRPAILSIIHLTFYSSIIDLFAIFTCDLQIFNISKLTSVFMPNSTAIFILLLCHNRIILYILIASNSDVLT